MSEGLERVSRMVGHFPPSSRVTGVRCVAAADMTMRPTLGLPENASANEIAEDFYQKHH